MTNGEKLKELFNTYFPGAPLNENNLADTCWLLECPVKSMSEEELAKLSGDSGCACNGCSYDHWWDQEYKEPTVEYCEADVNVTIDIFDLLEGVNDIEELKRIHQKTKELINAAYGSKALQVKQEAIGTDQFIQKENEGGF